MFFVAILSALLSFLLKQIGKILQAVFGWSITALFGRLPQAKQTAVSVALLLSVVWPVFVVGLVFPAAAAWVVAFLPLEKWLGATALRVLWCVFAVITPAIVGLVVHWVARSKRGGVVSAMLHGYPVSLGFAAAFVITVITVPIVKLASLWRRWTDEHVFVQPRDHRYDEALRALAEACVMTGIEPEVGDVPLSMALSTKVIRFFARGAVAPMVVQDPKMLRAEGLELYLYPADLLIRGDKRKAAHVRAMMTRTSLERDAYLVADPAAQNVQDEICAVWTAAEKSGRDGKHQLGEIRRWLDTRDIAFEDWSTLERITRHVERELARPHAPKENEVMATQKSTAELVKEAVEEAKQLVRIEAELAKEEVKKEAKQAEGAGIAFGAAAAFAIVCLSMLGVAIVIAAGGTVVAALVVAGVCLVIAGGAAGIGWALMPKKPLEHTIEHAETDFRQLKEHAV
jgi:hypothetical protein